MSSVRDIPSTTATLDAVWRVLKWHSKGKTCIETINRLWQKNQRMWGVPHAPKFEESDLRALREQWGLEELWSLLHPSQVTELKPVSVDHDVIAIRPIDKTFILDGRRRINHWKRIGRTEPINVLVILPETHK
jgi:hypothetical protein